MSLTEMMEEAAELKPDVTKVAGKLLTEPSIVNPNPKAQDEFILSEAGIGEVDAECAAPLDHS